MHNLKKTILLIATVISFIIVILIVSFPKPKKSTYNDFDNVMNKNGCNVEITHDKNGNIVHYTTESEENDCHFNIKYIEFKNKKNLKEEFNKLVVGVYDNENVKGSSKITINFGILFIERATNGDYYKSANVYKNAILYLECPGKYRNQALEIKDDLCFYWEPRWIALILFVIPLFFYNNYEELKKEK